MFSTSLENKRAMNSFIIHAYIHVFIIIYFYLKKVSIIKIGIKTTITFRYKLTQPYVVTHIHSRFITPTHASLPRIYIFTQYPSTGCSRIPWNTCIHTSCSTIFHQRKKTEQRITRKMAATYSSIFDCNFFLSPVINRTWPCLHG